MTLTRKQKRRLILFDKAISKSDELIALVEKEVELLKKRRLGLIQLKEKEEDDLGMPKYS